MFLRQKRSVTKRQTLVIFKTVMLTKLIFRQPGWIKNSSALREASLISYSVNVMLHKKRVSSYRGSIALWNDLLKYAHSLSGNDTSSVALGGVEWDLISNAPGGGYLTSVAGWQNYRKIPLLKQLRCQVEGVCTWSCKLANARLKAQSTDRGWHIWSWNYHYFHLFLHARFPYSLFLISSRGEESKCFHKKWEI